MPSRSLIFCSLIAACTAILFAGTANAATTVYSAPGGSGTTCSQAAPCNYIYSVGTKAQNGDTVVFAGGDYSIPSDFAISKAISLEGAKSGVPTRFIGVPAVTRTVWYQGSATADAAHITDIHAVNSAVGGYGFFVLNSMTTELVLDRVYGEVSATNSAGIFATMPSGGGPVLVRNSIGRSTGANSTGLRVSGPFTGSPGVVNLRNDIGDSRGPSGNGIAFLGNGDGVTTCSSVSGAMKNSYARAASGPANDLAVVNGTGSFPCSTNLQSVNSNFRNASGGGTLVPSAGDQHAVDAIFVNAAGGDYHQQANSPTIDAGAVDASLGPEDIDHQARVQGKAPDIGVDEFNIPLDLAAPVGASLKFTPKSFRPNPGKPASITAVKKKKPKGSTVSFTLSEAATVNFTVEQKLKGRKKGSKCVAKRKTGRKCSFYKAVKGSFSRASTAGANTLKFSGFVNGKSLKPGSYRLVATPTDAAGNTGAAFLGAFTILKP
jgi:hypothetical protein